MSDWEDEDSSSTTKLTSHTAAKFNKYDNRNGSNKDDDDDGWGDSNDVRPREMARDRNDNDRSTNDGCSFEVERQHVGLVIGRSGATVREIQDRFNVNLKIGKLVQKQTA